jgi:hypothetical protein
VGWPRRCMCTNIFVGDGVGGCREGSDAWMRVRAHPLMLLDVGRIMGEVWSALV